MSSQRNQASSRFSSTAQSRTPSSGISKPQPSSSIPSLLKYPPFIKFDEFGDQPPVKGMFCYVIKHYGHTGLSVLVYRQRDGNVVVICGDWNGNRLDLTASDKTIEIELANQFLNTDFMKLYQVMQLIKLEQAQFFFGIVEKQLVLCDVQVALLKFASPGFVRDLFGKMCRTQEVVKLEVIDDRAVEYIRNGSGSYACDLVIKPTKFRNIEHNGHRPLYVEILRA